MSFGEGGEENKSKMSRPFGVSLLIAGVDRPVPAGAGTALPGPQLYHMDPSGTYVRYQAQAIGTGSESARGLLKERYSAGMSLKAATVMLVRILAETVEDKVNATNIEVAHITTRGYELLGKAQLEEAIAAAAAEAAVEAAR